jgi:hypothetical protein
MLDRVRMMSNIDEFCQRMSVYAIKKMNIIGIFIIYQVVIRTQKHTVN